MTSSTGLKSVMVAEPAVSAFGPTTVSPSFEVALSTSNIVGTISLVTLPMVPKPGVSVKARSETSPAKLRARFPQSTPDPETTVDSPRVESPKKKVSLPGPPVS
ncbi:hypothetical protein ACP6PM_06295 [Dapis sp. BLCC M229]